MKDNFIKATHEFNTLEKAIAAPYIRKSFYCDVKTTAKVTVAACGFYELYINGKNCTKGYFAPYISNPEDYIYYDEYQLPLDKGENVLGMILGNGFQNNPGGYIWEFDKASFRSAPMVSVSVIYKNGSGDWVTIKSDKTFKTAPSPIIAMIIVLVKFMMEILKLKIGIKRGLMTLFGIMLLKQCLPKGN